MHLLLHDATGKDYLFFFGRKFEQNNSPNPVSGHDMSTGSDCAVWPMPSSIVTVAQALVGAMVAVAYRVKLSSTD